MNFSFGDYKLDPNVPELTRNGERVSIEPKVFDILHYLVEHRDRTISKDELIDHVWDGRIVSDAAVTSRINLVRQAVGDSGKDQKLIQTVPKRGFRFVGEIVGGAPASKDPEQEKPAAEPGDQVSVLVLPFNDLSQGEAIFLAQGLTEDLIVALSRHSDVSVISFNTAQRLSESSRMLETPLTQLMVDFLVSGTVRTASGQVRITIQLSDRRTGTTIFSDKFDRKLDDVFALQDEIIQALAGRLPLRVADAVGRKLSTEKAPRLTSYERLIELTNAFEKSYDIHRYIGSMKQLVSQDNGYAFAHAQLAFFTAYKVFVTGQQSEEDRQDAIASAKQALRLAPHNERVLSRSAMVYQFLGQYAVAMQQSLMAMQLNPHSNICAHLHANILGASGSAEEALVLHKATQALDPLVPEFYFEGMIETLFVLERYEEALAIVDTWRDPIRHVWAHTAALAAMAGDKKRAKQSVEQFEDTHPVGYSNATFVAAHLRYHSRPEDRARWLGAFRKSGLSGLDEL